MKNIKINLTGILVLVFLLTTSFASGCMMGSGIRGNGDVVKEERNIEAFDEIQISGAYTVYLTQGNTEKLVIEADENLIDLIITKVVDGKLKIYNKEDFRDPQKLDIYLTFVDIDELSASGAVEIESMNKFTLNELSLDASGATEIFLNIELKELNAELSGASEFEIVGFAKEVDIEISGASELDASDFKVEEIPAQDIDDVSVSSTKIRRALHAGNLKTANNYLGYHFMLNGKVVNGKKLGGKIGYPTANIDVKETYKLIPKTGVYVVKSTIDNQTIFGMMNIGNRPTLNGNHQTIEIHFFDFNQDLYDKNLTIELIYFLRDERKFDSVDLLIDQLKKDEQTARNYIKENNAL